MSGIVLRIRLTCGTVLTAIDMRADGVGVAVGRLVSHWGVRLDAVQDSAGRRVWSAGRAAETLRDAQSLAGKRDPYPAGLSVPVPYESAQ